MITLTIFAPVFTGTIIARIILAAVMLLGGLSAIILVLLQKGNSDGTSALSGGGGARNNEQDVESFYGKNKGLRRDSRLKFYTWICTGLVTVCSIVFFILGQ